MSIPLWAQSLTLILLASLFSGKPTFGNNLNQEVLEFPIDYNVPIYLRDFSSRRDVHFRTTSYGNTKLRVLVNETDSEEKSQIFLQNDDLAGNGGATTVSPVSINADGQFVYEVTLKGKGVYHLIPSKTQKRWEVRCLAQCGRKEVTLGDVVKKLNRSELNYFSDKISHYLRIKLPQNEMSRSLIKRLVALIANQEEGPLSRFPTLPPIFRVSEHRNLITLALKGREGVIETELPGSWSEVVKYFEVTGRPQPEPISPETPNIGYGHFISQSIPLSMVAQNYALSRVMTKLAEQKGYEVKFPNIEGKTTLVKSLEDFIQVLWRTGHHIQLRDERTFANFLSFTYGEKYIRWPVWFKTQVLDSQKEELFFPSPHSQFVWQITGPTVNARVNFFLGINGVAFFPKFDEERPQWTGFKSKFQIFDESSKDRDLILKATIIAGKYLRRIRHESEQYAKDYPSDGYGFTGICNDSSAVIERAISQTTTFFPLFRAPKLNEESRVRDGLDDIFNELPRDIIPLNEQSLNPESEKLFYRRMIDMVSLPYDPNMIWDEKFFEQLNDLKAMAY